MASTTWGSGPSSCPGITPEGEEPGFALRSGEGSYTAHGIPAKGPGCCSHLQRPQAPFMACVCMCMNVCAQVCSRWKQRQARGPKTPYAPTLPHPCWRRCATNTQWGQQAVLFQGGPPPASLQAEPPGTDGLIRHTRSPAFLYPGKAVFNAPHLAGCVIYSHLYAERSRPKSLLHFHSFHCPQAQPRVNTHT